MVTPAGKRKAVAHLVDAHGIELQGVEFRTKANTSARDRAHVEDLLVLAGHGCDDRGSLAFVIGCERIALSLRLEAPDIRAGGEKLFVGLNRIAPGTSLM